ncbi:unnamed protein product [Lathyrus sativus]|nr:unnamed protein product [Lathyrus sativus]
MSNFISSAKVGSRILEDVPSVKKTILDAFSSRFRKFESTMPMLQLFDCPKLSLANREILHEEFSAEEIFEEFHGTKVLPKALLSSCIALVPKNINPQGLEEYRPISLVGCIYKVISKILAARLGKVISELVSRSQTTFIPSRQILDGVLEINEIIDLATRRKRSCRSIFGRVVFMEYV